MIALFLYSCHNDGKQNSSKNKQEKENNGDSIKRNTILENDLAKMGDYLYVPSTIIEEAKPELMNFMPKLSDSIKTILDSGSHSHP